MNSEWKIQTAEVSLLKLPLRTPLVTSYTTYSEIETVVLRLVTESGTIGWGEARADEHSTGESIQSSFSLIKNRLIPTLIGLDIRNAPAWFKEFGVLFQKAPASKAAIDIAFNDLTARSLNVPCWMLLGGRYKEEIQLSRVVSLASPEVMAAQAVTHLEAGFQIIKLKVGDPSDWRNDVKRLAAVRRAVGPTIKIKIDVNGQWKSPTKAMAAIEAMQPHRPEYVEQPVPPGEWAGMAPVRRRTGVPLMVDEGCNTLAAMLEIALRASADWVNLKVMACGGMHEVVKFNAVAEAASIGVQIGTLLETSIGSAAGLHLATSLSNVRWVEMGGPAMFQQDIGNILSWYQGDRVKVPDLPGLGITVDQAMISRFTVERWPL